MKKFSEGDVVKLKSGGPTMTVQGHDTRGYAICKWFNDREPTTETFSEESLKAVEDNDQKN